MKMYLVGGAVRDALMAHAHGAPAAAHGDRDWVVVGATPAMLAAEGYLPVGRDFPVFLHPQTREEYALARTERKSAPGYHGFTFHTDPGVTLLEDLARRDLTINAMAVNAAHADDPAQAPLFDPYNGRADLQARVLRHVTDAFAEDPVRILRVARFAARWPDFTVAPQTLALMRRMVINGEVDHLVPERVWQELSRGLMEQRPSRMFEVLHDCGALARLLPELEGKGGSGEPDPDFSLPLRFATLALALDDPALLRQVCERWRVPNDCRELAEVVLREHAHIHASADLDAAGVLRLLERCDAIRKPARFEDVLRVCEWKARSPSGRASPSAPSLDRLRRALRLALAVDTAEVAARAQADGLSGPRVGERILAARIAAIDHGPGESG